MNDTQPQEPNVKFDNNPARQAAELMPIRGAGVELQNFAQQVDYAKYMATAGAAIAKHLRGNVGACLAILDISQRWGFSPFLVARLCYVVNDQICFEAQLIHAVVERFAPLRGRLRYEYLGEGMERQCTVTGHFKGELEPVKYTSPKIGNIQPKNSPLWKVDEDQQLGYFSVRAWCRKWAPDVILGLNTRDELQDNPHIGADNAKDITGEAAALAERLASPRDKMPQEGFTAGAVERAVASEPLPGSWGPSSLKPRPSTSNAEQPKPATAVQAATEPKKRLGRPPLTEEQRARAQAVASEPQPRGVPEGEPIPEQFRRYPEPPPPTSQKEPSPDKGASLVRPLPATPGEYAEHVDRWTKKAKTPEECEAQWRAEINLRNQCGIVEEERRLIRDWVDARIKEIRGG